MGTDSKPPARGSKLRRQKARCPSPFSEHPDAAIDTKTVPKMPTRAKETHPMPLLVLDPYEQKRLIARRRKLGQDHHDEVWEGVYVMSPLADDVHQDLVGGLVYILRGIIQNTGSGQVRPGVNITDDPTNWKHNFRCPDVAVFLADTKAICQDTHWLGGPDFAVEIRSKGDRSRKKLPFYARIGTRELLIIDRHPTWALELYRLQPEGTLASTGRSTLEDPRDLPSEVLPLTFTLQPNPNNPKRPQILLTHQNQNPTQQWRI